MPQGRVPEREVPCRACGQPFRTTKVGRAAFYCHEPRCDEQRKATGFRVNPNGRYAQGLPGLPPIAREIMAMQAARERERERFERQWRREVEQWSEGRERRAPRAARQGAT